MPKNVETLEELLARPICYWCEKDFDDEAVLKRHMKQIHLGCPNCKKALDSPGGLRVHMMQVHKEEFKAVPRAKPGREDPSVEIYGMVGFPEDLLAGYKDRIREGYYRKAAEYRAKTGNPLPGSGEPVHDAQHNETPEQRKARLAEWIARKKAEKAAQQAGAANPNGQGSEGNTPSAADSPAVNADQQASPSNPIAPFNSASAVTPAAAYNAGSPSNENFGNGQWPAPYANPAYHVPGYQHTSISPAPHFPPAFPHPQAMPTPSAASPLPNFVPGQHSLPYASMPPQSYTGGISMPTANAPSTVPAPPRQNSLPSVPGLPQRPAFDSPNFSKEDMAKMHTGQQPVHAASYHTGPPLPFSNGAAPGLQFAPARTAAVVPNPPHAGPFPQNGTAQAGHGASHVPTAGPSGSSPQPQQNMSIQEQVGQLVDSVAKITAATSSVPTAEQPATKSASAHPTITQASISKKHAADTEPTEDKRASKRRKTQVLKLTEHSEHSPEERRAGRSRNIPEEWVGLVESNALPPEAVGLGTPHKSADTT